MTALYYDGVRCEPCGGTQRYRSSRDCVYCARERARAERAAGVTSERRPRARNRFEAQARADMARWVTVNKV